MFQTDAVVRMGPIPPRLLKLLHHVILFILLTIVWGVQERIVLAKNNPQCEKPLLLLFSQIWVLGILLYPISHTTLPLIDHNGKQSRRMAAA
jgi:hypothetical protein